jgi:hypothetical protein
MGEMEMPYRAVTTSVEGFLQQVACSYLRHGYWYYVFGQVPEDKDPSEVDEKLIRKYGINVSESTRARRKKAGLANLQYIRFERTFVILATKGKHRFFTEEAKLIRDIRNVPIRFAGYSISYKKGGRTKDGQPDQKWHSHVAIERRQYLELKALFAENATRESSAAIARALYHLPVVPYAPVRRQLLMMLREINRVRKKQGRPAIPSEVLPLRRKIVRPFGTDGLPLVLGASTEMLARLFLPIL